MAAVALLGLAAAPAGAQTRVRGITQVTGGASDNARGVAQPRQKRTTTAFGRTQVGLLVDHLTERQTHQLVYLAGGGAYAGKGGASSFAQELTLTSAFTWRRASLHLGGNVGHGVLNDIAPLYELNPGPDPDGDGPLPPPAPIVDLGPQPEGLVGYLGGGLSQALGVELGPRWSAYQAADLSLFSSLAGLESTPPVVATTHALGIERAFPRDALRLELDGGYESAPAMIWDDQIVPAAQGQFARLALGWAHQLAPGWRTDLALGAFSARPATDVPYVTAPAARGGVRWRGRHLRGALTLDRAPYASVVLGGIYQSERATLRALGRFGQDERFRFRGAFRVQRLTALGAPDELRGPATRWQGQAMLSARPWPRQHLEVGLTYRLTHQDGALVGRRRLRTFERNVLLVTVTAGFPLTGGE